ncbi:hypothetical protein BO94DRAFT_581426 [Aspergillus sclerotioniger CBS 115572]|uniref:Uncharacterized protein n=1 Tax=Aspergillus sclerotioniger CBS 115572 TaxID=1450535 RepID=A0A317X904_9EURO|nr:hypothetical protein BO94DRAFT_581426 [Aspergillus sclerotioniger CBS 115572]PWY95083.1 hypothetical protein BO94DRAFT_581426 [Aspergillus sclerotioniger CBS 115572]
MQKDMTRVGFEPTPSNDDQEAVKLNIKVDLNLTPWTNSAILPSDVEEARYFAIIKNSAICKAKPPMTEPYLYSCTVTNGIIRAPPASTGRHRTASVHREPRQFQASESGE